MSDEPKTEELGLGDLTKLLAFVRELQQFYAENKADIDAIVALVRKGIEFIRKLREGDTGGGFQA